MKMPKKLFALSASAVMFFSSLSFAKCYDANKLLNQLAPNRPKKALKVKKVFFDKDINMCVAEIDRGGQILRLIYTKDGRYILLGRVLDVKTKMDKYEEQAELQNRLSKKFIKKIFNKGYAYKIGDKKEPDYILIVDPHCPFCKRAVKKAIKNKDKYTVGLAIMPLNIDNIKQGIHIMCSSNPLEAYLKHKNISKKECKKGLDVLSIATKIRQKSHAMGVPIYVFKNGIVHVGLISSNNLLSDYINKK